MIFKNNIVLFASAVENFSWSYCGISSVLLVYIYIYNTMCIMYYAMYDTVLPSLNNIIVLCFV